MDHITRFLSIPPTSFFLFGARGTGKSTWIQSYCQSTVYIDLLKSSTFQTFSSTPEKLDQIVSAIPLSNEETTVVIDEIQRIPQLLFEVHRLIEIYKNIRFVLTGSSARKIKRAGIDLLAGRAMLKTMHPFMASELQTQFNLESALQYGMIPLVWASKIPAETLKSFTGAYLKEEVAYEGLTRNIGAFSRFLEAASFSHGSVLNISSIARECEIERKVAETYFSILEDLLIGWRVPVFTKRATRAPASHPKFYFFDCGVFKSLRPSGPLDIPQETNGAALEGLVAQHLKAWLAYSGDCGALYYWRTRGGSEVDFVLYGSDLFYAIEVKNSLRVRPEDLRGLKAFGEDYPEAQRLLVYRGKVRLKINGIMCIPCEEFLLNLVPGKVII